MVAPGDSRSAFPRQKSGVERKTAVFLCLLETGAQMLRVKENAAVAGSVCLRNCSVIGDFKEASCMIGETKMISLLSL